MMSPKCAAGAFIVSTEQIVRATISDKYDPVGAAGGVSVEQATDVTGEVSLPLCDGKSNTNRVGLCFNYRLSLNVCLNNKCKF